MNKSTTEKPAFAHSKRLGHAVPLICATLLTYSPSLMAWKNCENGVGQVAVTANNVVQLMHGPGDVVAGTWSALCALDSVFNGVAPTACRHMHATLLTAQVTGKIIIYSVVGTDCSPATFPHTGTIVGFAQVTLK